MERGENISPIIRIDFRQWILSRETVTIRNCYFAGSWENKRITIPPTPGVDVAILSSRETIPGTNALQLCDRECRVPAK